jgi:hypothetical protein
MLWPIWCRRLKTGFPCPPTKRPIKLECLSRESLPRGSISTVDPLVLTNSDQLLYKTTYLNEEVNCTKPPFSRGSLGMSLASLYQVSLMLASQARIIRLQ